MKSRSSNSTIRGYQDSYRVTCTCLSADGSLQVNVFNNRCIVYDSVTHQPQFQVNNGNTHHKSGIRMVQISPSNEYMITVGVDRQVCVWLLSSLSVTQSTALFPTRKIFYDPLHEFIKDADTLLFAKQTTHEPFRVNLTSYQNLMELPCASFLHSLTQTSTHVMSLVFFTSPNLQNRGEDTYNKSVVYPYPENMSFQTEFETVTINIPSILDTLHSNIDDTDDINNNNNDGNTDSNNKDTNNTHTSSDKSLHTSSSSNIHLHTNQGSTFHTGSILYCALGYDTRVQIFDVSRGVEIGTPLLLDQHVYSQKVQHSEQSPKQGYIEYNRPILIAGMTKGILSIWDIISHKCLYHSGNITNPTSVQNNALNKEENDILQGFLCPTSPHSGSVQSMAVTHSTAHSLYEHHFVPLIERSPSALLDKEGIDVVETHEPATFTGLGIANQNVAVLPSQQCTASIDSTVKIWKLSDFFQCKKNVLISPIHTVCLGSTVKQVLQTQNNQYFVALTFDGIIHVYNILAKVKIISINSKNTPECILIQSYSDEQQYTRVETMLKKVSNQRTQSHQQLYGAGSPIPTTTQDKVGKYVDPRISSYICTVRARFSSTEVLIDIYDVDFLHGRLVEAGIYSDQVKEYKRKRLVFPAAPQARTQASAGKDTSNYHVESVEIELEPPPEALEPYVMQGSTLILKHFKIEKKEDQIVSTNVSSETQESAFNTDRWNPNIQQTGIQQRQKTKSKDRITPIVYPYQQSTFNPQYGTTHTCNTNQIYGKLSRTAPEGVAWPKPQQMYSNIKSAEVRPGGVINRVVTQTRAPLYQSMRIGTMRGRPGPPSSEYISK